MARIDKRDPSSFRRAEDACRATTDGARLADAAMALLGCRSADEVYGVACDFMTQICPGSVIFVSEITPDVTFFITRRYAGIDDSVVGKFASLVGFEVLGKRWPIPIGFRDRVLDSTLSRFAGGFADLVSEDIPRPVAAVITKTFGIVDLFEVGIADGAHVLGNIAILTRTPGTIPPADLIETFVRHCYSALEGIRSANALRASEERYRTIAETLTNFVYSCEAGPGESYRIDWMAGAVEDLTGYTVAQVKEHGCWRFMVLPEDQPLFDANVTGLRPGQSATAEFRIVRSDGQMRWVRSTARAVAGSEPGAPHRVFGGCEDITPRKLGEAATRESDERFEAMFEEAPLGYQSLDEEGRFLEINPAWLATLGYARDEVIGKWFGEFLAPEYVDAFRERFPIFKAQGLIHSEFQMMHKSGERRFIAFEGRIGHRPDGSFKQTHCILADITERVRTDAALRESHDMIVNLTDQVPGVVYQYVLHPDGSSAFPFSSRGMNDIYEYSPDEVREDATPVFGRLHPEDYDRVAADIAESARTLQPFHCEFRVVLPRQGLRWRLSDAIPQRMDGGGTLWHGIISDVTERQQLEEDRERDLERLSRALTSTVEIVSQVVETRDPYTAGHQRRVSDLAVGIAQEMGMPAHDIDEVRTAALLHDVGKMSIPAEILSKPGALSRVEFELIKGHSEAGYRIISSAHMEGRTAEIVYEHHERCDGSGYPLGRTADELLPGAKVLMVADVVEAMMSHRPYRPAVGQDAALAEIERGSGGAYDAEVCAACVRLVRDKGFAFSTA